MSRKQKEPNLETASREELVDYVRRLKLSRDQMQTNNKALPAWMGRLNSGIALLSSEGSLAFQAMAERAGVRGHPSVTSRRPSTLRMPRTDWDGHCSIWHRTCISPITC